MRSFVQLAVVALLLAGLGTSEARAPVRRQYYDTRWSYKAPARTSPRSSGYYYKTYHYKAKKTDRSYKTQYVIYKPSKTKQFVYWYNPEKKTYWARCPTVKHPTYGQEVKKGKDYWSILPQEKRKASLNDIKDSDYGEITTQAPYIPGSDDKTTIDCPSNQLPEE